MKWHHVVAAAAIGLPLAGQSPKQGGGSSEAARIEQRAQQMRDNIDAGRRIQSHVRVAVRLKNGNKLIGVVKDGKMVERVDGLRFVDAQAKDRGAGIRLWYTAGARSYVFVPFADFVEYEVLAQLTPKQLEDIESEMQMEERRRAERAEAAAAAAARAAGTAEGAPVPAPTDGELVPPAKPGKAAEKAAERAAEAEKALAAAKAATEVEQQQRAWFSLLQDYPAAAGWNKAKRDEISKRFVVLGVQPSEHEKRFVANFAEWEKGCTHFGVDPAAKKATEGEQPAEEPESRRGARSKREK